MTKELSLMNRYYIFRKLLDFVADGYEVSSANMLNYAGEIEITGTAEDGSTITVTVNMGGKKDVD